LELLVLAMLIVPVMMVAVLMVLPVFDVVVVLRSAETAATSDINGIRICTASGWDIVDSTVSDDAAPTADCAVDAEAVNNGDAKDSATKPPTVEPGPPGQMQHLSTQFLHSGHLRR
jgi:hypothetical protein